ncbi:MAG: hypothetical protein QXZ62_04270 [Candidatus Caldarchaeum sp.]
MAFSPFQHALRLVSLGVVVFTLVGGLAHQPALDIFLPKTEYHVARIVCEETGLNCL